jgi:hypothetical protein
MSRASCQVNGGGAEAPKRRERGRPGEVQEGRWAWKVSGWSTHNQLERVGDEVGCRLAAAKWQSQKVGR